MEERAALYNADLDEIIDFFRELSKKTKKKLLMELLGKTRSEYPVLKIKLIWQKKV